MTRGKGFTLVELLVVVSIIALLISILLPSLGAARETTRRAVCASNLHQINAAALAYKVSNRTLPYNYHTIGGGVGNVRVFYPPIFRYTIWMPYVGNRMEIFGCPSGWRASHSLDNSDGNWPDDKISGGYFNMGDLPVDAGNGGFNQWGPLNDLKFSDEIARGSQLDSNRVLVTEGVQGYNNPNDSQADGLYFAHCKPTLSSGPFDGWRNPADLPACNGWSRGYGDLHVEWRSTNNDLADPDKFWNETWKYNHWYWARWYW
jgi:prepilin-type N-terminal cleavage/methylation domain-containing protein